MLRATAILLLVALTASPAQGAWSSFHNDERNAGFQPGTAYQVYEDLWWSLKVKDTQIDASPVVKDGVVLVGSWDKQVRAFDAESGQVKWNATTLTASVYSTPAIVAGRVFLVDSTGKLEARDLQKGTVLGTASVGPTRGSITIHEGKLFIGNEAGEMQAFDTETLTLLWKFPISSYSPGTITTTSGTTTTTTCDAKFLANGSQIRGAPAVYQGKVIFGSLNHWLFAVDELGNSGQTADLMWMFETQDAIFGSPAIDTANDRVIIGSYDEKVYAMPATVSGEGPIRVGATSTSPGTVCTAPKNIAAWTFSVPSDIGQSKVHSSPAVDGQRAYFGANNGRVYAVDLASGTKTWEFTTGGQVVSSPAVSNKIVVVGSDDAKLYWLNASTGAKLKEFIADAPIKSSPALDGDRTFIASFEGSVYMFGKKIPTRPDLRVSSITYAASVITVVVQNTGDGDAGESKLRLVIDGSLVGDLPVPAIKAGQETSVSQTIAATGGAHTVDATADQANTVTEKEENDNTRSQSMLFEDAPADDDQEDEGKKDSGGIPGPAPALVGLAVLGLALVLRRRR